MILLEWYNNFLKDRGLTTPTGNPLYTYKVVDAEFYQLQKVLKNTPLNHSNYQRWNACFVLYASEWWRRNYTEGYWKWEPIFDSIGKQPTVGQRNQLVETGFKCWKRKVHTSRSGSMDYLATVVIECGLALQTLGTDRRTWLQQLIKEAYTDLSLISFSEYEPYEIVEQVAEQQRLPQALKKPGFYVLIAQIVTEAIKLKREYKLGEQKSPTDFLDQHKPDWRYSFPIQIDIPVGKQFLDELLTEVAQLPEPRNYRIAMTRELISTNKGWKIKSILNIPNDFYDEEDLRFTSTNVDALPAKLDIEIRSSLDDNKIIGYAYRTQKSNKIGYRIADVVDYNLGFEQSFKTWSLFLNHQEKQFSHELPLPGGESLDKDLPWIFVESKNGTWQLKAMASYRTHATTAKVIAHKDWGKTGCIERIDSFDNDRDIYLIKGETIITSDDQNFSIITNAEKSDNSLYILQGVHFHYASNNNDLYVGFPSLYKLSTSTLSRTRLNQRVQVKRAGSNVWQDCPAELFGPMRIRLLGENQEVLFTKKICVLPKNFEIALESISPSEGKIKLINSSAFQVGLLGENIEANIERTSNGHHIAVKSSQHVPPKSIAFALVDPTGNRINLNITFPSTGAKFFDSNGNQLSNGSKQYIDKLYGLRLVLFNPTTLQKSYNLVFELINSSIPNIRIVKTIKFSSYHHEVAITNFLDIIRKLFAVTEMLDSEVRIKIEHGPSVSIKRYLSKVKVDSDNEVVTISDAPEGLVDTTIQAFRLDEDLAKQTIETLEPIIEEDSPNGQWRFNISDRQPGKWLLFPGKESSIMFRPRLWIVFGEGENDFEIEELDYIRDSAHIKDREKRTSSLAELTTKMAKNFNNPNWKEVEFLWGQTEHLPLNTFDVWTAFAKKDEAIISLLLYMPVSLTERLIGEYPILLEAIPVKTWLDITKIFYGHWLSTLPELAADIIESKLQYLENQFSLNCLARILRSEILNIKIQELQLGSNIDWIKNQLSMQFNGGLGFQGLNQRNRSNRWPVHLASQLVESFNMLPPEVNAIVPQNVSGFTRSVVYLPFLLAAATVNPEAFQLPEEDFDTLYKIKETQEFDKEWFNAVYDLMQCYYWMN